MLNASPSQSTAGALPWAHLDIPNRMAVVMRRVRLIGGDDRVTLDDFKREEETCDLSETQLTAHIGQAKILLISGTPEPTYNRAERVRHGAAAVLALLPSREAIMDCLTLHNFPRREASDLAHDVVAVVADAWLKSGATIQGIPDWGRKLLSENAG